MLLRNGWLMVYVRNISIVGLLRGWLARLLLEFVAGHLACQGIHIYP